MRRFIAILAGLALAVLSSIGAHAQGVRFQTPSEQFLNASGVPYAGGFLYFYASGTTTPLSTYSNSALSIANPNPVVLDSSGRAGAIFLQALAYKVVLQDSNSNQIWTADPVNAETTSAWGATSTGSANQQSLSISGYQQVAGATTSFIAGYTNTTGVTMNINLTGLVAIDKRTAAGLIALAPGDLQVGQVYTIIDDGTIYELVTPQSASGSIGTIASAPTTDLGTLPQQSITISGTTTITSFGSSATIGDVKFITFSGALALTENSTSLILPGGATIGTAAGDTAVARYEGSGNWRVLAYTPAGGSAAALFANLKIVNDPAVANTKVDLSADLVLLTGPGGAPQRCSALSVVIDLTTGGTTSTANGMDGEARATTGWDYVYAIGNGTTCAGLVSSSSSAPTLPTGYVTKMRLGAVRLDGTQALFCTLQEGRRAQYVVTASSGVCNGSAHVTNTIALPVAASGVAGSTTVPTWVAVTVTGNGFAAPSTASHILGAAFPGTGVVIAAPNGNYGAADAATNPAPVQISVSSYASVPFDFVIETTAIDWAASAASAILTIIGWEDNL